VAFHAMTMHARCSALSNSCNPNPKMLCHDAVTWNHSRSCGQQCKLKLLTYIDAYFYTADHNFLSGSKFQSTLLGVGDLKIS
jgi:hypothetical protein